MKQNINNANLSTFTKEVAYPKMGPETQNCWQDPRPRSGTHLIGRTRDPKSRIQEQRPSRWDLEFETRDPKSGTQDLRFGTVKVDFK